MFKKLKDNIAFSDVLVLAGLSIIDAATFSISPTAGEFALGGFLVLIGFLISRN